MLDVEAVGVARKMELSVGEKIQAWEVKPRSEQSKVDDMRSDCRHNFDYVGGRSATIL